MTGANLPGSHVIDLVAGRDFTPDGTIEAAEVRAGDPCPDCDDGVLESARGIEMGHIFQLGRMYAEALGLQVLDENGKLVTVTMGSYGIGPSRAVAAIAEGTLDELGLAWPRNVAPADVHLVAAGKDEHVHAAAERVAHELATRGVEVILDDRPKVSPGVKFKDAELIGVPTIVVVGKGLATGTIEVKDRRTGERQDVAGRPCRRPPGAAGPCLSGSVERRHRRGHLRLGRHADPVARRGLPRRVAGAGPGGGHHPDPGRRPARARGSPARGRLGRSGGAAATTSAARPSPTCSPRPGSTTTRTC